MSEAITDEQLSDLVSSTKYCLSLGADLWCPSDERLKAVAQLAQAELSRRAAVPVAVEVTYDLAVQLAFEVDPQGQRRITACSIADLIDFANKAAAYGASIRSIGEKGNE